MKISSPKMIAHYVSVICDIQLQYGHLLAYFYQILNCFAVVSSKDVCCQPTANAPSDVMVGAVGEPRFGAE